MSSHTQWPATGPLGVDGAVAWLQDPDTQAVIEEHLNRYFRGDPADAFSGRFFEVFCKKSEHQDRFGPYDVLAAETLSVTIPSEVVEWLLEPDSTRDDLLTECVEAANSASQVGLWSCDESWLLESSPFSRSYETLRRPELGPTKRSKLLATKLPAVVPIRDSLVEELLGLTSSRTWWEHIRRLLNAGNPPIWQQLMNLPLPDGTPEVSVLRRLDVVLWMEARERGLGRRRYPTQTQQTD
jgi:hypothetical protein